MMIFQIYKPTILQAFAIPLYQIRALEASRYTVNYPDFSNSFVCEGTAPEIRVKYVIIGISPNQRIRNPPVSGNT
jgi:hypothetical protein